MPYNSDDPASIFPGTARYDSTHVDTSFLALRLSWNARHRNRECHRRHEPQTFFHGILHDGDTTRSNTRRQIVAAGSML